MQLPTDVEYAIRILLYVYKHEGGLLTIAEIVTATGITQVGVTRLAPMLAGSGLLNSVRGRNGGYAPGRHIDEISLYDVYMATEGDLQIRACMQDGQRCTKNDPDTCDIHSFFCELQDAMIMELKETSIADLASGPP